MIQQLKHMGINPSAIHCNLSQEGWREQELNRKEGRLSDNGTVIVNTGIYTGRSPNDRFIVKTEENKDLVDWGEINQSLSEEAFDLLEKAVKKEMDEKELFIFDGFAGADKRYQLPLRVITLKSWQGHFSHNMFIRPKSEELSNFKPEFTILNAHSTDIKNWKELGLNSKVFIILNLKKKIAIIGGTEYGGEIKKSVFSALNFYLPLKGVMPMHCSANIGLNEDTALFFGLSGTGKTTLSADPNRPLIGDDEHGWSDDGVFNFEGGCYAKCIKLSKEGEPQIWDAIKFGAVLENIVLDEDTRIPDYDDGSKTENTRVAYPVDYIPDAIIPSICGHPKNVIFLTADAFGVLPPVSKLTSEQAMYYFINGYTSKLAGTEAGITKPQPNFSPCFGGPFLPRRPMEYAQWLEKRVEEQDSNVWLLNTGWTGGAYGTGERFSLKYTRAFVTAILDGSLAQSEFVQHPIFGLYFPTTAPNVPAEVLDPRQTWADGGAYDATANELAQKFRSNDEKYDMSDAVRAAGPSA